VGSLAFWYPAIYFLQPGVLWPDLAPYQPLQIVSLFVLLFHAMKSGREYRRLDGFGHPAFKWMVGYMSVQSISVIGGGLAGVLDEVLYLAPLAEFVVLSLLLIDSQSAFRKYVWGMMAGSMWLVGYGIYSYAVGGRAAFGGLAGAYGNYENHNDYSFIIIQVLPFVYMMRRDAVAFAPRALLGIALVACVVGTLLSMSRGAMITLVLESSLIVVFTFPRRTRLLLLPLVLVVGVAGVGYQYARRAEQNGDNYTAADAESSRYELWKAGYNMFLAHPLLGVGNRRFREHAADYYDLSHDQRGKVAHNTYIQIAADTGILGLVTFLGMLFATRREARRPFVTPEGREVDGIRMAVLVALLSMLLRAFFDSKGHDWSFYLFVVVVSALSEHRRKYDETKTEDRDPETTLAPGPFAPTRVV
jgi:putative inorganic carbon (hco3(-)) transporter